MPLVLLLVFLPIQVALHFQADAVVEAAAAEGLRAAQTGGDAKTAAQRVLSQNGSGLLKEVSVFDPVGGDMITVRVTARVNDAIPYFDKLLVATATGPRERFIAETDR